MNDEDPGTLLSVIIAGAIAIYAAIMVFAAGVLAFYFFNW